MNIENNKHVVKSFPTFPQRAGKVDEQITIFMEHWLSEENEMLTVEMVIPFPANTANGIEQMMLVVFERNAKK